MSGSQMGEQERRGLFGPSTVEDLLTRARVVPSHDEALALVAEALATQWLAVLTRGRLALRARRLTRPQATIGALRASGLHCLLAEGWIHGRITPAAADRYLSDMRRALADRRCSAADLKDGILAFDGLAQRMALAEVKGRFSYPTRGNGERDRLLAFARALHR